MNELKSKLNQLSITNLYNMALDCKREAHMECEVDNFKYRKAIYYLEIGLPKVYALQIDIEKYKTYAYYFFKLAELYYLEDRFDKAIYYAEYTMLLDQKESTQAARELLEKIKNYINDND